MTDDQWAEIINQVRSHGFSSDLWNKLNDREKDMFLAGMAYAMLIEKEKK